MLYNLIAEQDEGTKDKPRITRLYRNDKTGTETKLQLIYTDGEGRKWFGFTDLYKIPYARLAMARHITDMYSLGITLKDLKTWANDVKTLARSNEQDKYEKIYAKALEIESIVDFSDPTMQQLALCTVYIVADDERIDYFTEDQSAKKLQLWKPHPQMIAFFLTWHTDHIQRYIKRLDNISKTVSKVQQYQKQVQTASNPDS